MKARSLPTLIMALIAGLAAGTTSPAAAQDFKISEDDKWCDSSHDHWTDDDRYRHCEVREARLSSLDELNVDAEPNGGISVRAWAEGGILLRAKVTTYAKSAERAVEIARDVSISTVGAIDSDGPHSSDSESYSVSFEIFAPSSTNLDLESLNGGISIDGMTGRTRFQTQNGGVTLTTVSGDVRGETTNGGVTVALDGDSWTGDGLDVETTNGGIEITIPTGYSAELETGTVNGRVKVDFPVMVEGTLDKRINATLGEGGKTIRAVTTNGSVRVKRG